MTIWILLFVILGVSGEEVFRMMQENLLAVVLTSSYVIAKVKMAASILTDKKKNASYAFMERTFGVQHNSVKQYYAIIQVT